METFQFCSELGKIYMSVMKILCLHGVGTNSQVFETQLGKWHFLDPPLVRHALEHITSKHPLRNGRQPHVRVCRRHLASSHGP